MSNCRTSCSLQSVWTSVSILGSRPMPPFASARAASLISSLVGWEVSHLRGAFTIYANRMTSAYGVDREIDGTKRSADAKQLTAFDCGRLPSRGGRFDLCRGWQEGIFRVG